MLPEIDKVLKKVAEGVETFEETLDKIETSTNANQKEKYESDLKKEIKKLQRLRDQIKTWISSSDIKDKRALMDNRKLIELQMEKFKAIEKEMKTKAYSREGLIMSGRMDPKEKEKAETCAWVTDRVEALTIQMEALEAEVETIQVGTKKGKNNPAKERISELEEKIERHKWHQGRLELILRLLENGQIDTDRVLAIQEDVNYYVDENQDPDFAEDEEIYTDLSLEEEEDYFTVGMDDHSASQDHDEKTKEEQEAAPKKPAKEPEPEPSPTKPAAKTIPPKKPSVPESKETKPTPAPATPTATKPTPAAAPTSRQPPLPRAGSVESPVIQYATAVAANLPAEPSRAGPTSVSPNVAEAVLNKESPKSVSASAKVEVPSPAAAAAVAVAPSHSPAPHAPASAPSPSASQEKVKAQASPAPTTAAAASSTTVPSTAAAAPVKASPVTEPASAAVVQTTPGPMSSGQSPSTSEKPVYKDDFAATSPTSQAPPSEPEIRLPAALADLAHSFEVSKERAMSKDVGFFVHQMLEASYQLIPEAADTERPKYYTPKNPYPTPSYYPQTPPPGLFENPAMFEKFDIDTLFFVFYYQQGTYQQYLAARELKKQSWRFHKKYLTWFQRHEEPKAITDDYEQGTYIYFDYEGAWCQRKKTDFRFEYKFLEDSELV
ncbi:general negative regulator of transcription subunit 5 [Dissophora globulifera]|uniref:General negative regulator of transcription subunit n=1 Tax=Dissophora globulifera TaxID=979702 RepID=A0A9P6RGZ7_9FUNG|nr:general negative regulator of transcription subunit 5 [Dissophora globulifera]